MNLYRNAAGWFGRRLARVDDTMLRVAADGNRQSFREWLLATEMAAQNQTHQALIGQPPEDGEVRPTMSGQYMTQIERLLSANGHLRTKKQCV